MRFPPATAVAVVVVAVAASGSSGKGAVQQLAWAPPVLRSPVTLTVTNANRRLFLDDTRDYRLVVAQPLKRELWIEGGRNIVVVGGHITVDELGVESSYQDNTALKIRGGNPSGTVHIEGVAIAGAYVNDGVAIATRRNVQLENVRVERAHDAIKGGHADCVQIQQGVGQLRIDHLTCTTERQGIFLDDHTGHIGGTILRNVDLYAAGGTHLLWQTSPTHPVTLDNVRLAIAAGYEPWAPFGFWVYPQRDGRTYAGAVDRRRHAVVSRDGKRLWFVGSRIAGVVRKMPTGELDLVPLGVAGVGYRTPGYLQLSRE